MKKKTNGRKSYQSIKSRILNSKDWTDRHILAAYQDKEALEFKDLLDFIFFAAGVPDPSQCWKGDEISNKLYQHLAQLDDAFFDRLARAIRFHNRKKARAVDPTYAALEWLSYTAESYDMQVLRNVCPGKDDRTLRRLAKEYKITIKAGQRGRPKKNGAHLRPG